jgi:hypothetical protein
MDGSTIKQDKNILIHNTDGLTLAILSTTWMKTSNFETTVPKAIDATGNHDWLRVGKVGHNDDPPASTTTSALMRALAAASALSMAMNRTISEPLLDWMP